MNTTYTIIHIEVIPLLVIGGATIASYFIYYSDFSTLTNDKYMIMLLG